MHVATVVEALLCPRAEIESRIAAIDVALQDVQQFNEAVRFCPSFRQEVSLIGRCK